MRFRGIVAYPEVTRYHLQELGEMLEKNRTSTTSSWPSPSTTLCTIPTPEGWAPPGAHFGGSGGERRTNEFLRWAHLVKMGHFSDLVNGWQGGCIRVGDVIADQTHGPSAPGTATTLLFTDANLLRPRALRQSAHRLCPKTRGCGALIHGEHAQTM